MNYVITIVNPEAQDLLTTICSELGLPLILVLSGEGTADKSIRSLLGMDYPHEKRIIMTIASEENTIRLKQAEKRYLDIDAPGHGASAVIPVKSVGGRSTLAYLSNNISEPKKKPDYDAGHELILCIINRGTSDLVMNAAKKAGAAGGTVLHARRTGKTSQQFFNVTLSNEKEVLMIITAASIRNAIMTSILKEAGPSSKAGTIIISLPVTSVAGIDELIEK